MKEKVYVTELGDYIEYDTDEIENCCAHFEFDSKTLSSWIAHCIRKHVKGDEKPKLKRDQCIAAGHQKMRKGELTR